LAKIGPVLVLKSKVPSTYENIKLDTSNSKKQKTKENQNQGFQFCQKLIKKTRTKGPPLHKNNK
jgi:hypothetical protein